MTGKALDLSKLPIQLHVLDTPPLEEIATVFQKELPKNFVDVSAEVIDCPDLTKEPFNLAGEGLGGNPAIIELGGVGYLLPLVNREKVYDLNTIPKLVSDHKCFIIGAGAGPWPYIGVNCEGIYNVVVDENNGVVTPGTRAARIVEDGKVKLIKIPPDQNTCCLLGNIFSSRGERCKVLKIHCKKRKGDLDFITSLRLAIKQSFPNKVIGMGGVFVLVQGQAKQHVMPDFSKTPINNDEEVDQWLKFFNMSAPLSTVGTFVSNDPGLGLRLQHFHSFGKTEGGHYHKDVTPDNVEYLAIMTTGCTLVRVDRSPADLTFGKD